MITQLKTSRLALGGALLALALTAGIACDAVEPTEEETTSIQEETGEESDPIESIDGFPAGATILPIGDSRVDGGRPHHESYRYELWKDLIDNGWTFDFVGVNLDEATYPDHRGEAFDRDHAGFGGATTEDILDLLDGLNAENAPDIVLLGIGGNDIADLEPGDDVEGAVQEAISNIEAIIQRFQAANPDVVVFVEEIAPGTSEFMTPERTEIFEGFNADLGRMLADASTPTSAVITVEMHSGWSDAYMADQVHYNAAGAELVAARYDQALEAYFTHSAN